MDEPFRETEAVFLLGLDREGGKFSSLSFFVAQN